MQMTARNKYLSLLAAFILVLGGGVAWWQVREADAQLRAEAIHQAELVAGAINVRRVQALSGSAADADTPTYQRLKSQLRAIRANDPRYRVAYLMHRKADGGIAFLVDSEAPDSPDYSPPGQIYTEADEAFRRAFSARQPDVVGPYTDRWGTWVTPLIQIRDPQTRTVGVATTTEAKALVQAAVAYQKSHGREALLAAINDPKGAFNKGDLYAFAYSHDMTMRAHPVKPELVGQNLLDGKDWAGGKAFRREMREVALRQGTGWVDYEYQNPASGVIEPKTTYVERSDDLIICAGAYAGSGAVIALLGMDRDARDWNSALVHAALPSGLTTLALLAILGLAWWRLAHPTPGRLRWDIPALIAAAGLVVTACVAWMTRSHEQYRRDETFHVLADARLGALGTLLRTLRDVEIEGLATFFEGSERVSAAEFNTYANFLTRNQSVRAWEWIPAVPAAELAACESSAQADGLTGFRIWQQDASGQRVPASGRDTYYPVRLVQPIAGNETALGFDLGSEPLRRAALTTAQRSGLTTGSDVITLVQGSGSQRGMLIYRPVYVPGDAKQLRGFALAVLRFGDALACAPSDETASTGLFLARPDGSNKHLAGAPKQADGLRVEHPINAFGKTFIASAQAGPEFLRQHPLWAWELVAAIGVGLSLIIAFVVRRIRQDRLWLENQVLERTRALHEERERLAGIIHGTNAGTWEWNVQTGETIFNERWAAIVGYTLEELAPISIATWKRLVHPEDGNESSDNLQAHIGGKTDAYDCECRMRHKDGSWVWIHDRGRVVKRSTDGRPLIMRGTHIDITERKQAEAILVEQEQRLRQLMDGLDAGVIIVDPKTRLIESVNPYAARLFGAQPEEILGYICHRFICPAEVGKCPVLDLGCDVENSERVLLRIDGARVPILKSVRRITIAGKPKLLETFVDISKQKQIEKSLLETNLQLEQQTAIAYELSARAEMASAAKSAFLANMSHEIRTPMNGILGMTELLLGTGLSAEQEDYARVAYHSAESLLTLLNDILDFSKIDAGKLSLESIPFAPGAAVYEIVELFRPRSDSGVEVLVRLGPDLPQRVLGDPGRWRQILTNLVGNAIKFTAKGHVLIDLSWQENQLVLAVSDTGIGIAPAQAKQLFAPFVQADDSTGRRFGGTGLGLAICRRLAELMGGKITLESREGVGSTFTVSVPLPASEVARTVEIPVQGLAGRRILVIDDNALNCRIICEQLTLLGARPESETYARQAVATLYASADGDDPFTAAIVDLHMPDLEGLAVAASIQAKPSTRDLPLVLLSASGTKSDGMAEHGFAGYLVKPARLEVLGAVLSTAIAHRQQGLRDLVTRHSVQESSGPNQAQSAEQLGGRVLLVEDNPINQKLARIMLGHLGISVTVAENGQQALDLLAAQPFDLVFMDCQMPVMDGYEATAALRVRETREGRPHIPVIAMTAHAMAGDREKCLAAGMDDHVAKPIQERNLAEVLRRWHSMKTQQELLPATNPIETKDCFDPRPIQSIERRKPGSGRQFLTMLLEEIPVVIADLQQHLAENDLEGVRRVAHKAKGSFGSLGATELYRTCTELEAAARQNDRQSSTKLLTQVLQAVERLRPILLAGLQPETRS